MITEFFDYYRITGKMEILVGQILNGAYHGGGRHGN